MSWRFRKRVKIIPGVYLNFSKRGISTTIGPRGLSVNIGPGGSYLNTGIPGTGISIRQPLFSNKSQKTVPENTAGNIESDDEMTNKLTHILEQYYDGSRQIKSESIDQLTSGGFQILKKAIISAHTEYAEIEGLISDRSNLKRIIDKKLFRLNRSLFKFLFKKKITRLSEESSGLHDELAELEEQKRLSAVELNIQSDETFASLYQSVEKAYQLISKCSKIWDITTSKDINRKQQRSFADTEIRRIEVKARVEDSGLIVTAHSPLKLHNKNGGDLFFYPGFIIVHEQHFDFAILDYSEFNIEFSSVQFVETEAVPADAIIVGNTWARVNKNGTPDKRFRDNYQIPLAKYGRIDFLSGTGLNESFLFSNHQYANLFYLALKEYVKAIKTSNDLIDQFNK